MAINIHKVKNIFTIGFQKSKIKLKIAFINYRNFAVQGISSGTNKLKINSILPKLSKSDILPNFESNSLQLLSPYLKETRKIKIKYSFVIDETVAKSIVKKINQSINDKNVVIIEGNPGLGLLTHFFIKSDVKKILVYDNSDLQNIYLKRLRNEYSNILEIFPGSLFAEFSRTEKTLSNLFLTGLQSKESFVITGVTPNRNFFNYLRFIIIRDKLWKTDLVNLYLISSDIGIKIITQKETEDRFFITDFYHLLYNVEILEEYPCDAFLPVMNHRFKKMYLLKITKNQKVIDKITVDKVEEFLIFLKILNRRKYSLLIPTLEKWIPECGLNLISKGITLTMQVQDLSLMEIVDAFAICCECENYSHFRSLTANYFNFESFEYETQKK